MKKVVLLVTHLLALALGFALGIYLLPTLIAPPAPSAEQVKAVSQVAKYNAQFTRDLEGSDFLHWGEGQVTLSETEIALMGELAPGPDYQLYLVPVFVENEAQFEAVKAQSRLIGPVKTFDNFLVPVPQTVNLEQYTTVVVWCETFGEFITAAKYR